jgi:antirestriction protein ArdC
VVAALRSALVPFRPQASELVKARRGKAGFTRNQTKSKTPCPCREAGKKKGAEKMNTYEIVTERIVHLLEHGVIPWRRPWAATGLPRNLVSKKTYRGVNSFLLGATKYVSPYWLTLKQANQLGGSVRKGEHGEIVIFWKVEGAEEADRGTTNIEGNETARRRLLLKFYRVWTSNSAHCRKRCSTGCPRSRC